MKSITLGAPLAALLAFAPVSGLAEEGHHHGAGAHAGHGAKHAHAASAEHGAFKFESLILRTNIADRPSAGFLRITNNGDKDDVLIAASSALYGKIELHTHVEEDGVMRMRAVENIPTPAGQTVELKRGGLHLMMFDPAPNAPKEGHAPVTLVFEHAGEVTLMFKLQALGAKKPHSH